ncbi:hypothetical protein WJX72_002649 [[Myrmecia] bisecta]|uniref:Uncharacterized protein n=1 Tax=[Myrmecia] bisecta TaxID=41462 RepID=A0AAW1QQF0_9CHLO
MGLSAALPAPPSNHPGGSPGNWQEQWRQAEGQAQCLEGDRHFFGHGCPCSWELAFRCYTKAAELGSAAGMCRLAACYQKGRGCLKDEAAAVHWYRRAAGHADLDALHALGELYESGELAAAGVAQDFKKAAKYYRRAAEAGHLGSQASLGFLYEQGLGLAQEPAAALKWYTAAAERGHAKAQNNLGALLSCGAPPNVEADPEAAVEWYRKSSQQGNAAAMNNLGIAAEEGAGMERDLEAAAALYRVAAEMGHGPAHANLAHLCVAQQDWVQAEEHFRRAADAGEGDAWLHLGTIYEHGLGHVRDLHAALRYYERAAAHGVLQADDCIGQALDKIDSQVGLDADPGELLERVHNSDACLASAKAELAVLRARLERSQAECETLHDELQLSGSGSHSFPAAAVTGRTLTAGGPTLTSSGSFLSAGREPSGGSMRRSSSMEQLGSSLSGGGRRTGSILNYRSPLLGRKNNSMPTDLLRSLVGRVYDDAAAADAGSQGQRQQFTTPATSTSPEFAGGPPATASVAAQPATAVARSGSLTPPGQAAEDQSLPVMRKAPAVDRSAILDSTGPLELRDQRSVTRAAAMPQPPAAAPVRPPGTALGSAPRQFSLKKSPSPLFSRQSSAARSVLEVSGPSYEAGPPSPTRRMNADATQRLQRKLAQRRERRKSSMGPIFSFTSRAASESRGHAAAEPLALPCGKSMAKAGGPGQARGTAASQRFVEKMTIMERVQQMSNRQLVKLKADNALLEDRAKDAEATATTLGQVMQKLYVRVMALEEQLRSAGLQPVQPAGTTIDTVAGIPVDDLGVAYSLPTAQLYNVFALRRPIDVPLDDEYGDVDDGFNAVPPEFFSTGSHHPPLGRRASVSAMHDAPPLPHATAPATMQGSEEASKQPSLLASSSSRRLSNPEVPPIRAAFDQSLRKQTLHNAMRLSTDVNQGPLGDEGLAGTPTAAPIGSEPTAGDPTNPTGQPTPAQPKKPRSILSQKSASDLSLKERRNSRLTIRIQGDAEPVLPAARSMVRASSTLT